MKSAIQRLLPWFLLLLPLGLPVGAQPTTPAPPELDAKGYLLVDFHTGKTLAELNADERLEPASLTKIMTAYAVFRELASERIKLTDQVLVSERAWRTGGSKMFIEVGKQVSLEDLLKGMIIQSGNDASIALAEAVAGTEETFAALMNQYAARLGMRNSNFRNSTGLADDGHLVSARDMALLARAVIREFPEYYHYYSDREYTWNGITQANRNGLLDRDPSVDGMKTGHTSTAGYCLVSSAQRDGMRLIAVVMGVPAATAAAGFKAREDASLALLNYGFGFFETRRLQPKGAEITTARVFGAEGGEAAVGLRDEFYVTVPRGRADDVKLEIRLEPSLAAPLAADRRVGSLRATLDGRLVAVQALYPLADVAEGGIFRRLWDRVAAWLA